MDLILIRNGAHSLALADDMMDLIVSRNQLYQIAAGGDRRQPHDTIRSLSILSTRHGVDIKVLASVIYELAVWEQCQPSIPIRFDE